MRDAEVLNVPGVVFAAFDTGGFCVNAARKVIGSPQCSHWVLPVMVTARGARLLLWIRHTEYAYYLSVKATQIHGYPKSYGDSNPIVVSYDQQRCHESLDY